MYYFYPDELEQLVTPNDEKHKLFRTDVGSFIADFDRAIAKYEAAKLGTKADKKDITPKTTKTVKKTETPSQPQSDDETFIISRDSEYSTDKNE